MENETKIRSASSPQVKIPLPNGQVIDGYMDFEAIYIKKGEDVDTLLKKLALGAQLLSQFTLPEAGIPVIITQTIRPAKIQAASAAPPQKGLYKK